MSIRTDGTVKGFCVTIDVHGGEIKTDVEYTAERKISKEEQKLLQKSGLVDKILLKHHMPETARRPQGDDLKGKR